MKRLKAYFSFENETYLEGGEVFDVLTETSILEAEEYLLKQKVDVSNIYFKLLSQIQFLEKDVEKTETK